MKKQKNFGLSQQEKRQETYDHWDLGFISKDSVKSRIDDRRAETERKRMNTEVMRQVALEPTQNQTGGISTGTAIAIGLIVVVGLLVGYSMMNNRKKKQTALQKNTAVINEIV